MLDGNIYWEGKEDDKRPSLGPPEGPSPIRFFIIGLVIGFIVVLFGLHVLDNKITNDKIKASGIEYHRPGSKGNRALDVVYGYWNAVSRHNYDEAMAYVDDPEILRTLQELKNAYYQSLYESGVSEMEFRRALGKVLTYTYYCTYDGKESKKVHRVKASVSISKYSLYSGGIKERRTYNFLFFVEERKGGYKIIGMRSLD